VKTVFKDFYFIKRTVPSRYRWEWLRSLRMGYRWYRRSQSDFVENSGIGGMSTWTLWGPAQLRPNHRRGITFSRYERIYGEFLFLSIFSWLLNVLHIVLLLIWLLIFDRMKIRWWMVVSDSAFYPSFKWLELRG
jgi:hypothetical protein